MAPTLNTKLLSSIRNPSPNNLFSLNNNNIRRTSSFSSSLRSSSQPPPLKYAVLGAGFAGLSVAWHLLQQSPKDSRMCVDLYDEVGIGGGASGVSGGLIHPYSPKGKLLWRGGECWQECLKLLDIAEKATSQDELLVWRRGIFRPATTMKNVDILKENAQNCLGSCRIEYMDEDGAQNLIPNLSLPFKSAIYMPQAINIHPRRYLQALFLACKNLVKDFATSGCGGKEICLHKKSVNSLLELEGEYNAVVICLGAKVDMLPELSGKLPLRTCRGVVAHLQLPNEFREEYRDSPSILSDAWLAIQGPRNLVMGSTWDWKSRNYFSEVCADEASKALQELLPKVSTVYPGIKKWAFNGAKAGLRAMPPLTSLGSVPILGCVDDAVGGKSSCKYWLLGGLGSRGLLYHGWLGKLMAQAVISCNENVFPTELTSWRKLKFTSSRN
ncbi:hypothetical protein GIB67_016767 [Kingdonia uniflora]|uniref:FAD dependent oxidoreductase domain-containing protein n=1 Tax=Kingdonia uniflora TaxID=39325 RepID=A0A7J7LXZ6_9MAGN|nr:hypothetical protein GIB67_016767 [Kingdonia uniflora]